MRHRFLLILIALIGVLALGMQSRAARPLEAKLLDAARAQPRAWYPPGATSPGVAESDTDYAARLEIITLAVAEATGAERDDGSFAVVPPTWRWHRSTLAAAILTHFYEESRFALEVHAGEVHPVWTQDDGRARCLGQLHEGLVPEKDWRELAGLELAATKRCVLWTARALTRMALYCSPRDARRVENILLPMFSAMGGNGCGVTVAGRRKVATFAKVWRQMER